MTSIGLLSAMGLAVVVHGCGSDAPKTVERPGGDAGEILARPVTCEDGAGLLPSDLRCTGLYSDFDARTIAPEAREYTPALSLWSDGAQKRRWLSLPAGTQIDTSDMDEWIFPVGTKVWKEFAFEGKPLETRLFAKQGPSQWAYTTYVWEKDGARATRLDSGQTNALGDYEIPNRVHCSQCHTGRTDRLLGIEAISLGLPGATGITLTTLKDEGRLTTPPAVTTLALPGDPLTQRALGYLHVNCGIPCHNQNAAGTASFTGLLLRMSAKALLTPQDGGPLTPEGTDTYTTTVDKEFVAPSYIDDARFTAHKRLVPRNPDQSLILSVIAVRGAGQMPPIVSHKVDDAGVQLLREWIGALP